MDSSELYSSDSDNTDGFDATLDMYHPNHHIQDIPVIVSFCKLKAHIMLFVYVVIPIIKLFRISFAVDKFLVTQSL